MPTGDALDARPASPLRRGLGRLLAATVRVPAAPALALLLGLLFVFNPAHVFQVNRLFFYYGFAQLGLPLLVCFLVSFALAAWLSTLVGPRWGWLIAVAASAVAITAWVNSAFLTTSSGTLDGRVLRMLADPARVRGNTLVCLGVLAASAMVAYRWAAATRKVLSALFAVLALHAVWVAIVDDHPWRSGTAARRLASFSPDANVLVVLLDAFQSDFFEEIVEREPTLRRALDGFTYYRNAVGVAPTTYLALPSLHAGGHYVEGRSLRETYRAKVVEGSFLARHAGRGYDAFLVNPVMNYCPSGAGCDDAERLVRGGTRHVLNTSRTLFDLSLLRLSPDVYKPTVARWRLHPALAQHVTISNDALDLLARSMRADSRRPTIKFLHLFNTHPPISVDARCATVIGRPWAREHAVEQNRCALSHVIGVLRALEASGLYDRTAIALVADHGAGLPQDRSSPWTLGASASPLVLLKPFGARGPLAESPRPLSLSEVPGIVCGWTAACAAGENQRSPALEPPTHRFYSYAWKHDYWASGAVPIDDVFEVRGPPREIASWWRISRMPATAVGELDFGRGDAADAFGFGWAGPEPGHRGRWALGREADLYLRVPPGRLARIALDVATHRGNPDQTMTVLANGARIADLAVSTTRARHEIVVPADRVGEGLVRVEFRFSKWNAPGPSDTRALAVTFDRLRVRD